MNEKRIISSIKNKLTEQGGSVEIPLLKGGRSFIATNTPEGIRVNNLRNTPLLPWSVFTETIALLEKCGGQAIRGSAQSAKLGDPDLPLDSVEGHVASSVYGKQPGDSVYRRSTPIACILIWAGLCTHAPGKLILSQKIE